MDCPQEVNAGFPAYAGDACAAWPSNPPAQPLTMDSLVQRVLGTAVGVTVMRSGLRLTALMRDPLRVWPARRRVARPGLGVGRAAGCRPARLPPGRAQRACASRTGHWVYSPAMKRLLIIVCVLLLPLRLWAADAMALAALSAADAVAHAPCQPQASAAAAIGGFDHGAQADHGAADAQALADAGVDASAAPTHHPGAPCETDARCLLCGICHQTLGSPAGAVAASPATPSGEPPPVAMAPLQSERQPTLKPPIS